MTKGKTTKFLTIIITLLMTIQISIPLGYAQEGESAPQYKQVDLPLDAFNATTHYQSKTAFSGAEFLPGALRDADSNHYVSESAGKIQDSIVYIHVNKFVNVSFENKDHPIKRIQYIAGHPTLSIVDLALGNLTANDYDELAYNIAHVANDVEVIGFGRLDHNMPAQPVVIEAQVHVENMSHDYIAVTLDTSVDLKDYNYVGLRWKYGPEAREKVASLGDQRTGPIIAIDSLALYTLENKVKEPGIPAPKPAEGLPMPVEPVVTTPPAVEIPANPVFPVIDHPVVEAPIEPIAIPVEKPVVIAPPVVEPIEVPNVTPVAVPVEKPAPSTTPAAIHVPVIPPSGGGGGGGGGGGSSTPAPLKPAPVVIEKPAVNTVVDAKPSMIPVTFRDIDNHWGKENIEFVCGHGLLTGTGQNNFSPNVPMTRGMFITALGKLAKAEMKVEQKLPFNDVREGDYFRSYVTWAAEKNIVGGMANGEFAGNESITREQMALILMRYMQVMNMNLPKQQQETHFVDQRDISSWAVEAVAFVQSSGLMTGKNGNQFDPKGIATRAEAASLLRPLLQLSLDN